MAKGKHFGSFAGGFMEGLLGVMKMQMMQQQYAALQKHYEALDAHYARQEDFERFKYLHGEEYGKWLMGQNAGGKFKEDIGNVPPGANSARGVRNNNPGNLKDGDFAKSQPGYAGSDGQFAKFDTIANGTGAMDSLLKQNYSGMTYNQIFAKYAPASDNNDPVAYAKLVAGRMGQSPDEKPDFSNPDTMAKFRQNIVSVEQGIPYERVPDYLGSRGGGGEGEGTPALIDASNVIHTTGAAAENNAASQVHPAFANRIAALDADAYAATGTHLSFNEVHRTYAQQAAIRAAHERMPGGVHDHPAAPPGHSNHEDGTAGDANPGPAFNWAITPDANGVTPMERHGIERLKGDTLIHDPYHMQLPEADKNKTAQAEQPFKPYKTAGLGWVGPPTANLARPPGPVDQSLRARQAEAASRYGPDERIRTPDDSTDLVRPGPPDQRAPEPGTREDPASAGVGPTALTAEQLEQLRLQRVNANTPETGYPPQPIPNVARDRGPPYPPRDVVGGRPYPYPDPNTATDRGAAYPPPNVQPTPIPPITTTEGQPGIPPQAMTGRVPEMLVPTTQMPVDERNLPPVEARPSTVPPPSPGGAAEITRPVVGGDERLLPAVANAPAANAQPAVALRPEPQAQALPAQPGWGTIDRPNMDVIRGGRNNPGQQTQMGAFDFSTLWKPNPPIAQRGATPAPQPAQPQGPTPYGPNTARLNPSGNLVLNQPGQQERSVPVPTPPVRPTEVVTQPVTPRVTDVPLPPPRPPDTSTPTTVPPPVGSEHAITLRDEDQDYADADAGMAQTAQVAQMAGAIPLGPDDMAVGARKGGPIRSRRRYAAGGNVTRFATGGAAPTAAQLADPGWQNTPSTYTLPGNAPFTNQQVYNLSQTINSSPNPFLSPLSPSGSKDLTGFYGAYTPPTSAATAPAPLNEPAPTVTPISTPTLTSTANNAANGGTTTGAYQLPDIVAPTTSPTINTPTTTFNPTPRTPTTLVPNVLGRNASDIGGTNFKQPNATNTGAYAGFRRGGAIPRRATLGRYAAGGNVTSFAAGGAPATMAQLTSPAYAGPTVSGGWIGTPYDQLAPNQQAWADQQRGLVSQITAGGPGELTAAGQLTMMPDAVWPTAAGSAAPAPLNEPAPSVNAISTPTLTSTANNAANGGTTTGAYQLPDIVAPTNDPTINKPSTTYNATPRIPSTLVPNAPSGNASDIGGTNFKQPSTLNTGAYAGFRHGGAIPRRATLTRFAAAGAVPQNPSAVSSQQEMQALQKAIGYSPTSTAASLQASYNAMTPEQQAWYTSQNAALNGYNNAGGAAKLSYTPPTGGFGGQASTANQGQLMLAQNQQAMYQAQFNPNEPAAQAAAAAAASTPGAAAPAPIVNPTVTAVSHPVLTSTLNDAANGGTTTGAYHLPDVVAPVPAPTTTYNPTPKIPTTTVPNTPSTGASDIGATDTSKKPNTAGDTSMTSGAYAGFRRGGVTRRVTGYDDGGGVSPAPAGMLPGMGGNAPVPPIYYNPATYAGAGAPVGKGVTNTNANTFVAGAIPTLPMMRGGIVRYAEGGAVSDEEMQSAAGDVGDDDYGGGGAAGSTEQQYAMDYRPNADVVAGGRSGAEPSPGGGMDVGSAAPPSPTASQQGPPPGAPAWTPQVNDGQGNPSRGLTGAIAGGLHFLGGGTGLGGGQQGALAADPGVQTARQNFVSGRQLNGQPLPTGDEYLHEIPEAIGADGLHEGLKHLASMEAIHNFYLYRGEPEKADQMVAAMMQVSVGLARDYGKEAVARYYNGDLKGAVDAMNRSKDVIADGTIVKATVNPDGKTVTVAGQNLSGEALWRQVVAPQAILGAALHTADGSLPWHMYEISAAKYDQRSHDMIAARGQSAQSDQVNEAIGRMGPEFGDVIAPAGAQVTPASNAPPAPQPAQPQAPAMITAQTAPPAIPGLTPPPNASPIMDVAGGASGPDRRTPAQPPAGADTAGGTQPALTLAPTPAISGPGPTLARATDPANLPSQDAQEAALLTPQAEQAHYQQIVATTRPKYFTDDNRPIIGNRPMNVPQTLSEAILAKAVPEFRAAYNERWQHYKEAVQTNTAAMNSDIDSQRRDYSLGINTQRQAAATVAAAAKTAAGQAHAEQMQTERMREQEKLQTDRQTGQQTFETNKEDSARKYAAIRALTDQDISSERKDADGNDTITQGVYNALLTPDENAAIAQKRYNPMDLLGQKGYSQSDVNTMYQAVYNARRYTHDITIPNASELIGGLVSGAYKTDGPATPLGDGGDGVKRAMLTIVRPDGTSQHLALPENDAQSVARLWANKDAARQQEKTKQTRYDIDQGNAAINKRAAENAAAYQASQPPAAQDKFATPAPSQPFLNKPSYPPQPAMPPAPRPNDPYAPNAPPPGVGQGYRIW